MEKVVIFGPFIGEMYWEAGRFAPMLPFYKLKKYKNKDYKYIVFTREERFDLYGKYADILVPLRIKGDYEKFQPNCFRLDKYPQEEYKRITKLINDKYKQKFKIIEHIVPDIRKGKFVNKNQFSKSKMIFKYQPRNENYSLMNEYLPDDKPIVILAPRFRRGFKRNWKRWPDFYDRLYSDKQLMSEFNFIICGKKGEYIPDEKCRFYDMNNVIPKNNSSLIGLLLATMEKAFFTFGSQSAIPNISLLYKVDVLEFGCQKLLHTKSYNHFNTPITFLSDRKYTIEVNQIFAKFKSLLLNKKGV